jgi:ATP-dependent helicase HepA
MNNFIVGQRWISSTEAELGLGLILAVLAHRVTVLFLATDERRTYARDNAPLIRVKFAIGDEIESTEGLKYKVISFTEQQGLISYQGLNAAGQSIAIDEIELSHHLQFNKPQERLFTEQTDPNSWFLLRFQTWRQLQKQHQSPVKGLQGGRTSLIAHQLFIAQQVAQRYSPKVMLADEVGLGKTIEAGLILHQRLLNGLSQRVLIIVPESLSHQWLVEMLRRFNLRFSLFNETRCQVLNEDNPFKSEALVLASQSFFANNSPRQQQALAASWDMLVIDEAHHLQWHPVAPSADYLFVEQLCHQTQGVILLTATPEQLGQTSHFARLRLLDPDRFYDLAVFLEEQQHFQPIAKIAKQLLTDESLDAIAEKNLRNLLKEDGVEELLNALSDPNKAINARQQLINILLDYHGTGRILFRNSRQTIKGFPQRLSNGYPLPSESGLWLLEKLQQLAPQQVILITHLANTVIDLEKQLKQQGIRVAVFHEQMSIINRDKAAAYFADPDNNAQILLCSEIGSEGRNFQFAHHLILWDLPTNPDLLQQRIGRLDRIGQQSVIHIHIPYQADSPQQVLYRWYAEGLNAFKHNCSAAPEVATALADELQQVMQSTDTFIVDAFIAKTRQLMSKIDHELQAGRDLLLELNSCRPQIAQQLIQQLAQIAPDDLWTYAEALFDCYGVNSQYHSDDCYILTPSENLRLAHFPCLPEEGITVTVNRKIALMREDMQFLTWEHPLMVAAMDLVLSSETGNASLCVVTHPLLKGGQFLLECLFIVECSAPRYLQVGRFLPPTPIRILVDQNQQNISALIAHKDLIVTEDRLNKAHISGFLNNQRPLIQQLLAFARTQAQSEMRSLVDHSYQLMSDSLEYEIKRLQRLQKMNSSIKTAEIEQLQAVVQLLAESIQQAQLKFDAVRLIVVKESD